MLPPWAGEYVGIPFVELGRTRAGLDCWGLFGLVQREQFGRSVPDYPYRGAHDPKIPRLIADGQDAAARFASQWQDLENLPEEAGDLIILRIGGRPWHCAVNLGDGVMLHTQQRTGSILDRVDAPRWRSRLDGYYRWVGP